MGSPATVYGQDYPGEVAGLPIGEQQGGTSKLAGRGPPAERYLVVNEVQDLRIVVDSGVKGSAKRAWGQRVDSDSGSGQFDGKTAGELDDSSLARRVAAPGRGSDQAKRTGQGEDTTVPSGAHEPGGRTAGQPGSYDVDLQACAQRPDVELIKGAACLHARAGHEDVESTLVRRDPFDEVCDGALVGDITRAALHGAPGLGGQAGSGALAAFSRPAGEYDIGASIGQS